MTLHKRIWLRSATLSPLLLSFLLCSLERWCSIYVFLVISVN